MSYDVIGDIHGHYEKLVSLLSKLSYANTAGVWGHPGREAIFVGDLIDRGPHQVAVVDLVRRMVAAGTAKCVMGNHEFNAIAWATEDLDAPGEFLRSRTKPGNREQHAAFLKEVEKTPQHDEIIDWFKTLPLWLDLDGIRVVHACWHEASMELLRPLLTPIHTLTDEAVRRGSRRDDPAFAAIEVVCKGPEVRLPHGHSFADKEGKVRHEVRVRWWLPTVRTYREAAIVPPGHEGRVPADPLPAEWVGHVYEGPPVLFGHYWFTGTPAVISDRFACLDYSVAKDGPLVAYRWDGETELRTEKMVWV